MSITKTNGLLLIRQYCLDTDTNNPAITDTELTRVWNDVLQMVYPECAERLKTVADVSVGWNFTSAGTASGVSTAVFNDIRHVFREADTNAILGSVMEKKDLGHILHMQRTQPTQGTPREYALYRNSQTTLTSTIGLVRMFVWPLPSAASYFSVLHRPEPTELSGGTDKPDLNYNETYITIRLTAAIACMMLRKWDMAEGIAGGIEQRWVKAAGLGERFARIRQGASISG